MLDLSNQIPTSIDILENDDASTNLIGILCNVMHQCNLDGLDFDHLLSSAARKYFDELNREQAEERGVS